MIILYETNVNDLITVEPLPPLHLPEAIREPLPPAQLDQLIEDVQFQKKKERRCGV